MPTLRESLVEQDPGHLQIVAELWGVDSKARDPKDAITELVRQILGPDLVAETVEILPEAARDALADLQRQQGRLPWALFQRRYGEVREMGPGRRDRELPHRSPVSAAEVLWYRALIGRAFFDTETGPVEFAYIPNDLLPLLPPAPAETEAGEGGAELYGRPARPEERAHKLPASDRILDHACTLLAGIRIGLSPDTLNEFVPLPIPALKQILTAAGILDEGEVGGISSQATRHFLEAQRGPALSALFQVWRESDQINELALISHLVCEGEWQNDPMVARSAILGFLDALPKGVWWNINAFVDDIRTKRPDFQRPAGDYDSWFIRDARSGEYLRGFEHWDAVDGEVIRFSLAGPLHWLGFIDLAAPEPGTQPGAFRLSSWAGRLLAGDAPEGLPAETAAVSVRSDGFIDVPRLAPRSVRYQIARFCRWEPGIRAAYRYRLTPRALASARGEGLRVNQLLSLLQRHAKTLPPNIIKALDRWERGERAAQIESLTVLRVGSLEILKELRNSRAARFLGDPLGPTTIAIRPGAEDKVLGILLEMGYLGEWRRQV